MQTIINKFFILLIRIYRSVISPYLPPSCRFYPTCSEYSLTAFSRHPWYKAIWLSIRRIGKCHPWHKGGFDPVPDPTDSGLKHG